MEKTVKAAAKQTMPTYEEQERATARLRAVTGRMRGMAEDMLRIADQLNYDEGKPLSAWESELIRISAIPAISELTLIMRAAFLSNDKAGVDHALEELHRVMIEEF